MQRISFAFFYYKIQKKTTENIPLNTELGSPKGFVLHLEVFLIFYVEVQI